MGKKNRAAKKDKDQAGKKQGVTRRELLLSLGTGFVGFFLGGTEKIEKSIEVTPRLWEDLVTEKQRLLDHLKFDLQVRRDLLAKFLRISGTVHIVPPIGHPLYHKPGPHDIAAMTVAGSLFDNARPEPNAFDARLRATDGLFTSGSPTSSALAATFVPSIFTKTSHVPGTDLPLAVNKSAIPYHFHGGTAADLIVKSASQEGAERAVFNNGLVVNGEIWHPPQLSERGGRLKTDFLLLTVLPWSQGGGYAVIVSGGHGPGTGAFQLLMDPDFFSLRSLEKLIEDLGVARAYQVVFEVSVTHAGKYSAPNAIRVSSECPPQKIQTDSLFSSENDTLTNTVRAAIATNEVM